MQTQSSEDNFPKEIEDLGQGYYQNTIGRCCGSKRLKGDRKQTASFKRTYRGIKAAPGIHCEPYDNGKQRVDIVETSNGPITVSIRYAW